MEKGFAVVKRNWEPGDVVELNIPMPVRFVDCIPEVSENIGKTAVTRGPLVYCAEEVDNAGPVQRLYLGDVNESQAKVANISSGVLQGLESITLPGMEKKWKASPPVRSRWFLTTPGATGETTVRCWFG